MGNSVSKTRNWGFILYPSESAPENWREMLEQTHIPAFVSPLHDRDVDENGELKKPHYHILVMFDGPVTQKRANEIIAPFNGTQSAEYIYSLRGSTRYLSHLDNPEKAQYNPDEIIALSGADLGDMLRLGVSDKLKIIGEIIPYCKVNEIHEFSALTMYAITERPEWFSVIVEKAYFFHQNLNSLRHSKKS